ncbi:MAG: FGGY-family carbohydrate kinase [Clostridiales Family XIII bacterium]|jgi:xylulokinase|nr:FGGY-family carbohydrate kinase [Clostridiales Family XIII bacterium]
MTAYLIAHDLGTTGNKATLFSVNGGMIRSVTEKYPTYYTNGNWAEQEPEDWWNAFCTATKKLLRGFDASEVLAVSFSGQMMGCVCVDAQGRALRRAVIWADMRSGAQEAAIAQKISPEAFYRIAGHRLSRSYSIEKLMWIRDNEPEVFEKTHKALNAKDYIVCRLTGEFVTDFSDASGTNALDLGRMDWSDDILAAAGIDRDVFPEIYPSTKVAGSISSVVSEECGLAEGTKIVLGGGDGSCASVGAGSVAEGVTYNCLGSSSWICTASREPFFDKKMRTVTWAHVMPGLLIPGGTMQAAGVSFEWGKELLCSGDIAEAKANGEDVYGVINQRMEASPVGANALLFLPYLLGERCPRWNGDARGSFIGLKNEHTSGDLMRSIAEGVAMNLGIILEILKGAVPVTEMFIVGGMAQSGTIRQVLADVYGMDVIRLRHLEEATSIGAAVVAGVGVGVLSGFDAYELFNRADSRTSPTMENIAKYNKMKPLFEQAYQSQLALYRGLAAL